MNVKNYATALFVMDIESSKLFYTGIIGLEIELDLGKNVIFKGGLTIWEIRDNHIITEKIGHSNISNTSFTRFEIYFETEDIEGDLKQLKAANVKFLHELHEEPWGQFTFRFYDPDNHLIEIGESMTRFVKRMYKTGLDTDSISIRTGVRAEEVKRMINSE